VALLPARRRERVAVNGPETLISQISAVRAPGLEEVAERMIGYVTSHDDILERTCRPAHLTGSALVIEEGSGRLLLLFHTKLQRWLQPGGHADGDGDLARVALREATEETGIDSLRVQQPAIDLDIHTVDPPQEDAHLHLDVRFLVAAAPGSIVRGNHESEAQRWVHETDMEALGCDVGLLRLARTGLSQARAQGLIR
jgi:8-oxo-dGTP pyrophosphatase MutT (NUDIX family)